MGKLAAYILGVTTVIVLSYYVLSLDYSAIMNWLGPVTGVTIVFPFAFLYLLLGSFLSNPILLLVWIVIGAVVGVTARKGTRAIGAAIAVYFSVWAFLIGAFLTLAQSVSGTSLTRASIPVLSGSTSGFQIPPLPPGVTLTAILSEPLVQPLFTMISSLGGILPLGPLGGTSSGATTPTLTSFSSIAINTFLPYMVANIVVFMVVAGVVGWFMHNLLNKKRKSKASPADVQPDEQEYSAKKYRNHTNQSARLGLVHIMVISIVALVVLSSSTAFVYNESGTPDNQNFTVSNDSLSYSTVNQTIVSAGIITSAAMTNANSSGTNLTNVTSFSYGGGMVGKYGNIYNLYTFFNLNATQGSSFLSTGAAGQSILSLLLISENVPSIFRALAQDGIISDSLLNSLQNNQYYNLIPGDILVQMFSGNLSQTSSIATEAASNITSQMGAGSLNNFLSLSLPVYSQTSKVDYISIYAYSFTAPVQSSESKLVQASSPYMTEDGMFSAFTSGINDGYLVPASTSGSVNASIFIAGKIDLANLPSGIIGNTTLIPSFGNGNGTGVMDFIGGLFVKESVVHSSSTTHQLTASQIFGYSGKIYFNDTKTAYAASLTYPVPGNLTLGSTQYNSTIYTTVGNISVPGASGNITFVYMAYGSFLDFPSVNITTNAIFPASIRVSQAITAEPGNIYNVTVTFKNNDTDTMKNVNIYASQTLRKYGSNAELVSGSITSAATTLQPGQSISVHYGVKLSGVGTYILANPVFNYTISNTTFSVLGNSVTAQAQLPSVFNAVHSSQLSTFTTVSSVLHFPLIVQQIFPGFYFFDLIFVLIIVLAGYLEYRAFVKWDQKRKQERYQ